MSPYTTTVTKSNQITLTRPAREALGIKAGEKLIVETKGDSIVIHRRLSDEEFFKKLDSLKSEKTKAIIKKGLYKDVTNFRGLPSYKEELKEKYEV